MEKKDIKTFKDLLEWGIQINQQIAENNILITKNSKLMEKNNKLMEKTIKQHEENLKQHEENLKQQEKERKQREAQVALEKIQQDDERKQREAQIALEKIQQDDERKQREKQYRYEDVMWKMEMHKINKRIAEVTGTLGNYAEFEFAQAIKNNKKVCGGIHFDGIFCNAQLNREYDIVLVNGEYIGLVEVKWEADTKDIRKLIYKQAPALREAMPEHKNKKLIIFIASHVYKEKVATYANKLGVCFLYEKGHVLQDQYIEPLKVF